MPNNQLIRDHGTVDFSAGETVEVDLPRSHYYERLNLLVDWAVTSDGSDDENGYGLLDLIDRVEVEFNGSQTLKSVSFATSHLQDWLDYGTRPIFDDVDHTSATSQTGQMQTFIDFLTYPGHFGALLPSFRFSDLTLRIRFGNLADVGGDITGDDGTTVSIQSKERRKATVANPPKVTTQDVVDRLVGFKEREVVHTLDQTGENIVELPRGNAYYGIGIAMLDNDAPDTALVDTVEVVENGVETHRSSTLDLIRAKDAQEYGLESLPPGYASIDYGFRGRTDDVVSTKGMDAYELILDTASTAPTSPAEARVVTRELVT